MNARAEIKPAVRRCAVYTRKSSEEGLEQSFNSLHAQRDACESYVRSQVSEGWTCSPAQYDDGGISGGTMERPGLKQLLADIAAGLIDVVVVYKVDRLTRSLGDFSRIIEQFDAQGVSFVSVTQAFNTTTSMGRLTLNVLLSFAQFEREVTGERIRDKLAMSKAKGMWMGSVTPLGYDKGDHVLVPNEPEAATVRGIFRRYLQLASVHALCAELEGQGVRSKQWVTSKGKVLGGAVITRLYNALEAYRAGKSLSDGMTAVEASDFTRASVVALADLHTEIDRLTLDAYGWPAELKGDALLARAVALNAERRAEERRGEVRWLCPAYQRPRFARDKVAGADHAGDLARSASITTADRTSWPKEPRLQVLAIKGALFEAEELDAASLASRFKGRGAGTDVPRLLQVLQRGGQVRLSPAGGYSLLRAA